MNATKFCSIENCESRSYSRGWCRKHYMRWWTHGDPEYIKFRYTCSVDSCKNPHGSRGWCEMHYQRWAKHGSPIVGNTHYSDPENAFQARTEWQGDCLIWTGSKNDDGYGHIWVNGKSEGAHRYAWKRINGPIPDGMFIDHKDHCTTSCVNIDHLRLATSAQNNYNRSGPQPLGRTGVRNVSKHGTGWRVRVTKDGTIHQLGTYGTISESALVAEQARKELFGEYAGRG